MKTEAVVLEQLLTAFPWLRGSVYQGISRRRLAVLLTMVQILGIDEVAEFDQLMLGVRELDWEQAAAGLRGTMWRALNGHMVMMLAAVLEFDCHPNNIAQPKG